jgi:hypothetical protein
VFFCEKPSDYLSRLLVKLRSEKAGKMRDVEFGDLARAGELVGHSFGPPPSDWDDVSVAIRANLTLLRFLARTQDLSVTDGTWGSRERDPLVDIQPNCPAVDFGKTCNDRSSGVRRAFQPYAACRTD